MDYPSSPQTTATSATWRRFLCPWSPWRLAMGGGGLKGTMKLDDLTYEIKPLKDSERFEHVVSQIVADASATGPAFTPEHRT